MAPALTGSSLIPDPPTEEKHSRSAEVWAVFCTASICFFTGSKAAVNTAVGETRTQRLVLEGVEGLGATAPHAGPLERQDFLARSAPQ